MLDVSYKDYCLLCVNCKYGIRDEHCPARKEHVEYFNEEPDRALYICSKKKDMGYFDEDDDCEAAEVYELLHSAVMEGEDDEALRKDVTSIIENMVGFPRAGLYDIKKAIIRAFRKHGYYLPEYSEGLDPQ